MTATVFVEPTDVEVGMDAECALFVEAGHPFDQEMRPQASAAWEVGSWYVVDGLPVADGPLGLVDAPIFGVDALAASDLLDAPWEVEIGAQARFLPLVGTFTDDGTWSPWQGEDRIDLFSPGLAPTLDTTYAYQRGKRWVTNGAAVRLDNGEFLFTDGARWASEQVTVLMVAVLSDPGSEWAGLLETGPVEGTVTDADRYVSLLYGADGALRLSTNGGNLGYGQLVTGTARPGQPVIVGFSVSVAARRLHLCTLDRVAIVSSLATPTPPSMDARLVIGRTDAALRSAPAVMDILEVAYWTTPMSVADLYSTMAALDRIYQVSVD